MRFQAPRGTEDVLPGDSYKWIWLEQKFRELAHQYGYPEIRTPSFEDTDLFTRTAGDTSDIVTKQMYDFLDKGGRSITLKPEGTAPAVRALIEGNVLQQGQVTRVSYVTPIFRYERPQKGRLRESHQVGLELIGSTSPFADAEIIEFAAAFYQVLGLKNIVVKLNSIGRSECRARYREAILEFASEWVKTQTAEDQAKFQRNPLRLLDSKSPDVIELMSSAPSVLDFLEPESKDRLAQVEAELAAASVSYEVCPEIVRGLDYYTEIVFEVHSSSIGAQSALCGGGRYDNLIKELGGPEMPSVGFAAGVERALLVLEAEALQIPIRSLDAFIIVTGAECEAEAATLTRMLRKDGLAVQRDLDSKSLKAQFKVADRVGARFAVVIGEEEMKTGTYTVKELVTMEQKTVAKGSLIDHLRGRQ